MGWLAKVKRRKGGVYLFRMDHHRNPKRRVNGYVGETVSFRLREGQHLGLGQNAYRNVYMMAAVQAQVIRNQRAAQPWSDLNPRMYRIISLPWWLCWKWVLRPLETLVILATWPVYNDKKNRWNPRRIPIYLAKVQRSRRDHGLSTGWVDTHVLRRVFIALMVTVICMAAYVYAIYS